MNNILTGKCRDHFIDWLHTEYDDRHNVYFTNWSEFPFSYQQGVYLEFFDDKAITIAIQFDDVEDKLFSTVYYGSNLILGGAESKHRNEVLKETIKIVNDYYNERN